jgi:hypothetical protein
MAKEEGLGMVLSNERQKQDCSIDWQSRMILYKLQQFCAPVR